MSNLGTFSFQYGMEDPVSCNIEAGLTVEAAWRRVAGDVGADASRPVTFRAGGALLAGTATPQPGQTIIPTINHEQKGR